MPTKTMVASNISVGTLFHPKLGVRVAVERTDVVVDIVGKDRFLANTLFFDENNKPHFGKLPTGGTLSLKEIGEIVGKMSKTELENLQKEAEGGRKIEGL